VRLRYDPATSRPVRRPAMPSESSAVQQHWPTKFLRCVTCPGSMLVGRQGVDEGGAVRAYSEHPRVAASGIGCIGGMCVRRGRRRCCRRGRRRVGRAGRWLMCGQVLRLGECGADESLE
jgi:hypothetical protein